MISGVTITPLKRIADERGMVMHMLRNDSPGFSGFGEVYFSLVNPGAVKAWKRHSRMTQRLSVPRGKIRMVIFDGRDGSETEGNIAEHFLGEENYCLLTVPPGLWYGFQCVSSEAALVCNCPDMPHDPAESEKIDPSDPRIPYSWGPR